MISLDQVLLLEKKVESAVAKIQQLEAENAALRNKCSELTNALSAKSEQLTSYQSEQNKIESGIKKAIDRLNYIENSVLSNNVQLSSNNESEQSEETPDSLPSEISINKKSFEEMSIAEAMDSAPAQQPFPEETIIDEESADVSFTDDIPTTDSLFNSNDIDFNSMSPLQEESEDSVFEEEQNPDTAQHDDLGFDIF